MFRIKPTEFLARKGMYPYFVWSQNNNSQYKLALQDVVQSVHLWVVCFALSSWDLHHNITPCILGTVVQSLQQVGAHGGGFIMFRPTMQEVHSVEQFCWWKFNQIKVNFFRKIGGAFLVLLESAQWVRFCGGVFVNF